MGAVAPRTWLIVHHFFLVPCAHSPGQRTDEELDLIFEELLHIKAVAHLSNSVSPWPHPTLPSPKPPVL